LIAKLLECIELLLAQARQCPLFLTVETGLVLLARRCPGFRAENGCADTEAARRIERDIGDLRLTKARIPSDMPRYLFEFA
jgi:hypothetical protein